MIFLPRIQTIYLLQQRLVATIKVRKRREQGHAEAARGHVEESRRRADPFTLYFRTEAFVLLV